MYEKGTCESSAFKQKRVLSGLSVVTKWIKGEKKVHVNAEKEKRIIGLNFQF